MTAAADDDAYVAAGVLLPITPRFVEERLDGGNLEVGFVFASYAIASLLLRPVVGWSSDRFGRRPLLIGGAVLTVVGMLLHLAATDVVVLVGPCSARARRSSSSRHWQPPATWRRRNAAAKP